MSGSRPRRTSTRGSSSSRPSCRRPRAARCVVPSSALDSLRPVDRPAIGICTSLTDASWSVWERRAALTPYDYIAAIQRAGGLAVMIPPDQELERDPDQILDVID